MPAPSRRDLAALAAIAAATAALLAYRAVYIEPRPWGAACAAAPPPLACAPRAAFLWLQREYLYGAVSLLLGVLAFLFRVPFAVTIAAIIIGIAGVINYNATWGMAGACLAAWVWLEREKPVSAS